LAYLYLNRFFVCVQRVLLAFSLPYKFTFSPLYKECPAS
jgi:hypothetical protein